MATNKLLPFASGDTPNLVDFDTWNALPARLTGFQSGIAKSAEFNYILAQGGAAGYVIGQMVADHAAQDADLETTALYAAFKKALAAYIPGAVANGSIAGSKIADGSITLAKLAANSVDASKIATGAVGASEIADSAVSASKIASGAVTEEKIAANAVTAGKIADSAVSSSKIASGAVDASKIAAGAVGSTQLADSGVTSGSYGPTAAATLTYGGTFYVPQITFDEKGRATKSVHWALKIPAAPTSVSGNAGTATKLATKRKISATGDATWSVSFDGSGNASASLTLATVNDAPGTFGPTAAATLNYGGTFYVPQFTVDANGRVTLSKHWAIKLPATPTICSQAEAEAGTLNNKYMSPLRTKQAIDKLASTVPPGTMIHFAGKTLPDGWLICNGAAVSRKTYADLFKAIGTTYGTGDGSTTFNLPNARGRFLECTTSTSNVGNKVEAGLPNITGELTSTRSYGTTTGAFYQGSGKGYSHASQSDNDCVAFSASRSSSQYGKDSTVQPASLRVLGLIKL